MDDPLAVFDPPSLLDRCMGDTTVALTLLTMFEERLHGSVAEICDLFEQGVPLVKIARAAHSLKGSAGDLSALRLHQAAARLEEALRKDQRSEASVWVLRVKQEAQSFLELLPYVRSTLAE